jgi:hypothetical protein
MSTHDTPADAGDFSTIRAYTADARELSSLATLRGTTAANTFRELCAGVVRDALKAEMARRDGDRDKHAVKRRRKGSAETAKRGA